MSNINNKTQNLFALDIVQELSPETAATVTGGAGVPDVVLWAKPGRKGRRLPTSNKIADLRKFNFDNIASSVVVNKGKWAFYDLPNFQGERIVVDADTARDLPTKLNNKVSSLQAI